jgi:hypothetical protein
MNGGADAKECSKNACTSTSAGIPVPHRHSAMPSNVLSESALLASLVKPINIRRLYVDKEHAKAAIAVTRGLTRGNGYDGQDL